MNPLKILQSGKAVLLHTPAWLEKTPNGHSINISHIHFLRPHIVW